MDVFIESEFLRHERVTKQYSHMTQWFPSDPRGQNRRRMRAIIKSSRGQWPTVDIEARCVTLITATNARSRDRSNSVVPVLGYPSVPDRVWFGRGIQALKMGELS